MTMKEPRFSQATDEMRRAALALAAYNPALDCNPRLIPVRHAPTLPEERASAVRMTRPRQKLRPRAERNVGEHWGRLAITSKRPTLTGGGFHYTCSCQQCESVAEYTGHELARARTRNVGCVGCRRQVKRGGQ